VFGFAKNDQKDISEVELRAFRQLAALLLGYNDKQLEAALNSGSLLEVSPP
jgi:hypothetical protein